MGFVYTNVNPEKLLINDCVTRAISFALDLDYFDIQEKLYLTSSLYSCDRLSAECYENLLENVFGCIPVYCRGMTVEEFAEENPVGMFLIRVPHHLTVVWNGNIHDTWDCSFEQCDLAWFVP